MSGAAGARRGCPHCEAGGHTYSEAYKRQCLVRWAARQQQEARYAFYRRFAEHHGEGALRALIAEVVAAERRAGETESHR